MNFGSLSSASLSQILATVAGDTYSVSFYLGDFSTQGNGPANSFQVDFGGTTIFSETNFPLGPYALINETVEATSNSTVLSFQGSTSRIRLVWTMSQFPPLPPFRNPHRCS
jgi:hypothetical protein